MLRERRGGDRRQILGIAQTQSFHIATGVGFNQLEQQQSFSYLDRISKKKGRRRAPLGGLILFQY
jgi:hypothetical protein